MNKKILAPAFFVLLLLCCGCDTATSTDSQTQQKQEQLQAQGMAQTGLPGITNFSELKFVKRIYEKRDQANLSTYSYIQDMQGRLWHLCDSIGYGLPYSVQFSNPQKVEYLNDNSHIDGEYVMPQSEPNGLFMPSSAEGTWVDCINPKNPSDDEPMYVEPRVIVSQWKLNSAGEYGSVQ